jgi:hypothetical protein
MKRISMLAILLFAQATSAEPAAVRPFAAPPPGVEAVVTNSAPALALVERNLLQPLADKELGQSRFSRARMPAEERRVRILEQQHDPRGRPFVRFAVDARHGYLEESDEASWRLATITGCVYLDRSEIFVQKGDQYRPAALLLGKYVKPAAAPTCRAGRG